MRWSWKIAVVAGIPIYLHGTFLLLIGFILITDWSRSRDLASAFGGVFFILTIFGTVVLHELGHALTAKRFGIRTRDITLLPIGGMARMERIPDIPRQELWVALAGPAVNVVLAAATWLVAGILQPGQPLAVFDPMADGVLSRFITINIWLAGFNLLPAFPMDGGRVLRALLAERLEYVRATEIAASVGQGLAMVFGFVGLFLNPFLVFIALFVWMGASAEASTVTLRSAMSGIPVSRAMITDFRTVSADDPLHHVAGLVLAGSQRDFPVLDRGRLAGVLTRDALIRALAERGPATPSRDIMTSDFQTVEAREMLETAFARLEGCGCPVLPVLDDDRVIGLLTSDNVGEFVMIRDALRPSGR